MTSKIRKFSLPFNGSNPENFIKSLDKRKEYIDSVFLGIPSFVNNHCNILYLNDKHHVTANKNLYEENCKEFLLKTKKSYFKRLITINAGHYPMDIFEIKKFVNDEISKLVDLYDIDGIIFTDYNMACETHKLFPNLELHTSCNCFQWNTRIMEIWKQNAGISVFNPPREILRSPNKLKEMHNAGFKLKCLINEGCLFGCPQTVNHAMYFGSGKFKNLNTNCLRNDYSNIFKGNYIVPKWLKYLDEYVDIYKISGRNCTTKYIFKALDLYINECNDDNVYLDELATGGVITFLKVNKIKIPISGIPDKLLTCECKECDKTCFICRTLIDMYLKDLRTNNNE